MEPIDIKNFALLEAYFNSKGHLINSYEFQLLQEILGDLRERQLFFLLKKPNISRDINLLTEKFQYKIHDQYDEHQQKQVAVANQSGTFEYLEEQNKGTSFYQKMVVPLFYDDPRKKDSLLEDEIYPKKWVYRKDFRVLYEDYDIKIIVFLLKMISFHIAMPSEGETNMHLTILENGFYVNPKTPSVIQAFDNPYSYECSVIPLNEMAKWPREDLARARYLLEEQHLQIRKRFERVRK